MELGVHLPLMQFGEDRLTLERVAGAVDAARECGFAAVAANDHFVFQTPWLDGPTALASMIERSGRLTLATTISLAVLRAPVPLAKTLAALDVLSGGRVIAALGPGSSQRDYEALGVPFDERWKRFDEALGMLRALLARQACPDDARYYVVPADLELTPGPHREGGVPLWVGSWGSPAGLARVARAGDGWLASAYNTTPDGFAAGRAALGRALSDRGRAADGFPNALATMWTWVAKDAAERDRGAHRGPGAAAWARPRRAGRAALRRVGGALRAAAVALRRRGLPARVPVAAGRGAAPARARRRRRGAADGGERVRFGGHGGS